MKKQAYTIMAIAMLVSALSVSARAQISGATRMVVNIPFEFSVGNKTMPPGAYTVSCANPASGTKVLHFRSKDGRATVCPNKQRPWRSGRER
jgi:hypothetical protein